jgi:hypothetical protein
MLDQFGVAPHLLLSGCNGIWDDDRTIVGRHLRILRAGNTQGATDQGTADAQSSDTETKNSAVQVLAFQNETGVVEFAVH